MPRVGSADVGLSSTPADGGVSAAMPQVESQGRSASAFAGVLMAFAALQMLGVALIPVVTPYLQDRFAVDDAQIGLLTATFTLGVALVAIPMGARVLVLGRQDVVRGRRPVPRRQPHPGGAGDGRNDGYVAGYAMLACLALAGAAAGYIVLRRRTAS